MKTETQSFSISACFSMELRNSSSASAEEGEEM